MRVFELAKALGLPSKQLLEDLKAQGVKVKSNLGALDEETVKMVIKNLVRGGTVAPLATAVTTEEKVKEEKPAREKEAKPAKGKPARSSITRDVPEKLKIISAPPRPAPKPAAAPKEPVKAKEPPRSVPPPPVETARPVEGTRPAPAPPRPATPPPAPPAAAPAAPARPPGSRFDEPPQRLKIIGVGTPLVRKGPAPEKGGVVRRGIIRKVPTRPGIPPGAPGAAPPTPAGPRPPGPPAGPGVAAVRRIPVVGSGAGPHPPRAPQEGPPGRMPGRPPAKGFMPPSAPAPAPVSAKPGRPRRRVTKPGEKLEDRDFRKPSARMPERMVRHSKSKHRPREERKPVEAPPELKSIELPDLIPVNDLASRLEVSANEIIKVLMKQGLMYTINQNLPFDKAAQVAANFGFGAQMSAPTKEFVRVEDHEEDLDHRPPVVTVLGHVDHGKTSLLDAIRKTKIAESEAGGITQRIGAYIINHKNKPITFLDTPGHEAFTAMRARGAKVTDVAVLVVAADDGVMPQTSEAVDHARAAGVPIVVAINKIDKPQSNPDRVKQQLTELGLLAEDWGGDTVCIPVSAKQKMGLEDLLDMIVLVADMAELRANYKRRAVGTIIEAKMDKGLGPVATVLVQNGTLKAGHVVVVGRAFGKIRALINDQGEKVRKATPSVPVEIIGLSEAPEAGDILQVVEDEKIARQITEARAHKDREEKLAVVQRVTLDDLFRSMKEGVAKDLRLIIKADIQGSVEALRHALERLTTDEVKVQVIRGGVGTISESDIMLASASNAVIIGFNVRPDPNIRKMAQAERVDIRLYRVIYHAIEDIKAAMTGLLEPKYEEIMVGRADVRAIFKVSKVGVIAGTYVTEGRMLRDADCRLLRDGVVIFEGKLSSLRRFKDDVKEVQTGFECGIGIDKFAGIQVGDVIEAFQLKEMSREEA